MTRNWRFPVSLAAAGALLWLAACDSKPGEPATQASTASTSAQAAAGAAGVENAEGHDHVHSAPTQGTLVAIGNEQAHLEVKKEGKKLIFLILDAEAEYPVRIAAKSLDVTVKIGEESLLIALQAVASQLTGEEVGNTSQFEGTSDRLEGVERFEATLQSLEIKGEKFGPVTFPYPEGAD
jgi:hypothetical protein